MKYGDDYDDGAGNALVSPLKAMVKFHEEIKGSRETWKR